jgi:FkbM family methyltransferase
MLSTTNNSNLTNQDLPGFISYEVSGKSIVMEVAGLSLHDRAIVSSVLEHDEYFLKNRQSPDSLVFMDIGAHAGSFSVLVKTIWPNSIVHCFEPNPCVLPLLKKNVSKFSGIFVHEVAIAHQDLPLISVPTREHGIDIGASHLVKLDESIENHQCFPIQAITFNDAVALIEEHKIGMIKMDCEGAEWDIIKFMSEENKNKIEEIVGEWHNGTGIDFIVMAQQYLKNHVLSVFTDITQGQGRFQIKSLYHH